VSPFIIAVNVVVLLVCLTPVVGFALYPPMLWLSTRRRKPRTVGAAPTLPSVSMLIAVRNGETIVRDKIANALDLDYPSDRFEVIVASDGSTDRTEQIIRSFDDPRVKPLIFAEHVGKAAALNEGAGACRGEVIVFSDADALLDRDAVIALVGHFDDPVVGGVCGQRVIRRGDRELERAQSRYIRFDSTIKALESRAGRITSNDGKLYAIRRRLFRPIPPAVTDDLYVCLNVIHQGYDFIFEPAARASIHLPSRSPAHELQRRRRIVSRSLRGIRMMGALLNPFRYGAYAVGLLVNKVLRRLLPVCLIVIAAATAVLSIEHPAALAFLAVQVAFCAAALLYPALARVAWAKAIRRALSVPFYFFVGNYGTLLGLADFVRGRQVAKWDPIKTDA
jgi:cellulose synthase/poly-beta-1,6-N-acetylglucosamine synthase-like glycosyltransferase